MPKSYYQIERQVIDEFDRRERNKRRALFCVAAAAVTAPLFINPVAWAASTLMAGILVYGADKWDEQCILNRDVREGSRVFLKDLENKHSARLIRALERTLKKCGIKNVQFTAHQKSYFLSGGTPFYRAAIAREFFSGKKCISYDIDSFLELSGKSCQLLRIGMHEIGHIKNRDAYFIAGSYYMKALSGCFFLAACLTGSTIATAGLTAGLGLFLAGLTASDRIHEKRAELFSARRIGLGKVLKNLREEGQSETKKGRYPSSKEMLDYFIRIQKEAKRRYSKELALS